MSEPRGLWAFHGDGVVVDDRFVGAFAGCPLADILSRSFIVLCYKSQLTEMEACIFSSKM